MLVAQAGVTRPRSLLRARDALLKTDVVLLGVVVNAAASRVTAAFYGDYVYGEDPSGAGGADALKPPVRD